MRGMQGCVNSRIGIYAGKPHLGGHFSTRLPWQLLRITEHFVVRIRSASQDTVYWHWHWRWHWTTPMLSWPQVRSDPDGLSTELVKCYVRQLAYVLGGKSSICFLDQSLGG